MPLSRRQKITLASATVLIALPVVAAVALLNMDWNRAKPWLNARASEALGRPFAIAGDLALTWQQPATSAGQKTWRAYLPWPHLQAKDVRLGNPSAMARGDAVLDVGQIARWAGCIGNRSTVVPIADAKHDVFLSLAEPRRAAYRELDAWLDWYTRSA